MVEAKGKKKKKKKHSFSQKCKSCWVWNVLALSEGIALQITQKPNESHINTKNYSNDLLPQPKH